MDDGIRAGLANSPIISGKEESQEIRAFGWALGFAFSIFFLIAWRKGLPYSPLFFTAALFAAGSALLRPEMLRPVFRLWMKFARRLAAVNTTILMVVIYYGIMTPLAVILRLRGQDLLDSRLRTAASYWKAKTPAPDKKQYEKQY